MVNSDDPDRAIHVGTRVIHKGTAIGQVVGMYPSAHHAPPYFYIQFPSGTIVLAELEDLQNINDKREG